MTKFEVLTVAEDEGRSDRLTAKAESFHPNRQSLRFSITSTGNLIIQCVEPQGVCTRTTQIVAFDLDLDSLLQFVQEAKIFIEEEKIVKRLMGK